MIRRRTTPPMFPMEVEEDQDHYFLLPKPAQWFTTLISVQADLLHNCMVSLASPLLSIFSAASESKESAAKVRSLLLRKLGLGLLGAAYVCLVLTVVMLVAVAVGIAVVQLWVEEPVLLRERLHFDYTDAHPKAVFTFGEGIGGIPVAHTFQAYLLLLMPESDFNRHIGVFQVAAELLSTNGDVMEKSSQPCMLQFRSFPLRLTHTFIMGIPLLLGISGETQKIHIQILRHKERNPRSGAIRVTLIPRAGTSSPPQLYEAEIVMHSQLPWTKEVVHNWKWTFYVWASLYTYMMLLMILICCCRPLVFPMTTVSFRDQSERDLTTQVSREAQTRDGGERDTSELLRRWKDRRSKRKAMFLHDPIADTVGSSASSISITREDMSVAYEEDIGDSESVCLEGSSR